MIWFFYNILFRVVFTLMLPRYVPRVLRRGGYGPRFPELLGRFRPDVRQRLAEGPEPVWVHAVSVGELLIGLRVIDELRKRDASLRFLLSVTTSTARALAERSLRPDTRLIYFPADFPSFVRRALPRLRPRALLLVECELWPNWIRSLDARNIPVFLVNARLSNRSFRGYCAVRILTRRLFPRFRDVFAQTPRDRDRFVHLGARPDRTHALGNAKYDAAPRDPGKEEAALAEIRALGWGPDRTLLIGGSTWPGEEEFLLDRFLAWRENRPGLVLLLAPRHVERSGEIESLLKRRGVRWARQSRDAPGGGTPDVLLLDTTGELRHFYPAGDLVFIGKSLTAHGGQNPIEAAQRGRAVVCGPNMENFLSIAQDLRTVGAMVQARDAADLAARMEALLDDPERRRELGEKGAAFIAEQSGVLARTADCILKSGLSLAPAGGRPEMRLDDRAWMEGPRASPCRKRSQTRG